MMDMGTVKTEALPQGVALTASKKDLENPPARIPIPRSFPSLLSANASAHEILTVVEEQLQRQGVQMNALDKIHIAYPHKHTGKYPEHRNDATAAACSLQAKMTEVSPDITWVLADALHETVRLGRSENQSSKHTLMAQQVYEVDTDLQQGVNPFENTLNGGKDYFILTDWCCAQGTTLANLMSYISHNGGTVLAVAAGYGDLAQQESSVEIDFKNKTLNTGRIPDLARAFSGSAKKDGLDYTPEECVDIIEAGLKAHGNSLFSLTNGECTHLINSLQKEEGSCYAWSFKKASEDFGIDLKSFPPESAKSLTVQTQKGLASIFGWARSALQGQQQTPQSQRIHSGGFADNKITLTYK